jgi:hypothetical protein
VSKSEAPPEGPDDEEMEETELDGERDASRGAGSDVNRRNNSCGASRNSRVHVVQSSSSEEEEEESESLSETKISPPPS